MQERMPLAAPSCSFSLRCRSGCLWPFLVPPQELLPGWAFLFHQIPTPMQEGIVLAASQQELHMHTPTASMPNKRHEQGGGGWGDLQEASLAFLSADATARNGPIGKIHRRN